MLIGTILGIPAVIFAGLQVRFARLALVEDRIERAAQREYHRTSLAASLRAELDAIRTAAEADLKEFGGSDLSFPRVQQTNGARSIEGPERFQLSFAWTPLPQNTIEQAIGEADLLSLTVDQVRNLQGLRVRILRVNALIAHKMGLFSALVQANVPKDFFKTMYSDRPWAQDKAAALNIAIQDEVNHIVKECSNIVG